MKIPLKDIKGSTPRVRQSQSPERLEELAQSIREEGLIVPVKVRKNGDGYTLVYGHRRVAAAKMAGLKQIEAIVEDVPDKKLLTQALVENVVREDMAAIEVAKALQGILTDTGCTQAELATKLGWGSGDAVGGYLVMLAPELGLEQAEKANPGRITHKHVQEAKAGTDSLRDAAKVLKFAAKEDLSKRDTRKVAEVVRKAAAFGGDKAVTRVLAQSAAQIIATAPTLEPSKARPFSTRKVEGEVLFQWTKDPRVILAEEGIKAVSACVSAIARSDQDRGGGKAALKRLRTMVGNARDQIDDVLRGR